MKRGGGKVARNEIRDGGGGGHVRAVGGGAKHELLSHDTRP